MRKPDLDKLVRAVLDALTAGGVLVDDARVVELCAGKFFPAGDELPGVMVKVTAL